jgi:ketosteroid isomerase-like protein
MVRGFQQFGGIEIRKGDPTFVQADEDRYLLTPLFTMVKLQGTNETLVVTTKIGYPDGSDWYTTGIVTLRERKMLKQVLFFAPTSDAPGWRARWVEPLETEVGVRIEDRHRTGPSALSRAHRDVVARLHDLMDEGDYGALNEVFRTDVVVEYPQSGERVAGLENLGNIMRNYPGGHPRVSKEERVLLGDRGDHLLPTATDSTLRVHDVGDRLFSSIRTRYPDGSDWYTVSIFTFSEGRISKQVVYFAPVMPAPEWRRQWVVPDLGDY